MKSIRDAQFTRVLGAAAASLLLVGVVTGCAGSSEPKSADTVQASPEVEDAVDTDPGTVTEPSTSTDPVESDAAQTTATDELDATRGSEHAVLTKKELSAALLDLDALPDGFRSEPSSDSGDDICGVADPFEPKQEVAATYARETASSIDVVELRLAQYASAKKATAVIDTLADTVSTCTTDVLDGEQVVVGTATAPKVGDDAVAVTMSSAQIKGMQYVVRVGSVLVGVGGGAFPTLAAELLEDTLDAQVTKFEAAAAR